MYILTVAVITLCADLVFGQYSPCLSANGGSRACIPLSQCEQLLTLARKPDRTDQDTKLLHRSICGSRGNVAYVCCPESTDQRINSPQSCISPDGKIGQCINLYSCPHLTNLLQPPVSQEAISFVQSSRCFGPEEYSVCCGPPPTIPRYTTPRTTTLPEYDSQPDFAEPAFCPDLMNTFPPARSTECCGISVGVGNKIFGGNATGIDEYPWAVVIEYSIRSSQKIALSCGGALISGKYVLTAAHCMAGRILQNQTPQKVRLGEYNTTNEGKDCIRTSGAGEDCTDGAIKIRIEKTIPHPDYVYGQSKNHDIGLIRLRDTAPYTEFIRPICLPSKDFTQPENTPPYFSMYAVGWGATENSTISTIKRDVNLPFVSLDKCQSAYKTPGRRVSLWKGQLCAGGKEAMDSCRGDSGGPLMYENEEKFELIGIVSFGFGCGEKGVPGIYTNVYEYLDWIKSVTVE